MTPDQAKRSILHLDMDAFFVNVHILDHPEDGGIPLAVGGRPDQRGVVASASYEARQLGIRSAMPMSWAVRLCPELKIVGADWDRIRTCSKQVMHVLTEFGPVEQMSVDEAFVDLTGYHTPEDEALAIKNSVKAETLLPCSVGLASNKLLAKVASDHGKPEGFTVVPHGTEEAFLAPLPVRVIWGIGPRTAERLSTLGITTCGELAAADPQVLIANFGNQAEPMQRRAHGKDQRELQVDRGPAKSISQEWTFNKDIKDIAVLEEHLGKMVASVARSMKKRNLIAQTVSIKIREADFTTYTRQKTIVVGTDNEQEILELASRLLEENWRDNMWVRLLGVGVSKLQEAHVRQLGFNF